MTFVFAGSLVVLLVGMSAIDLASWRLPNSWNVILFTIGLLWAGWSGNLLTGLLGSVVGLVAPMLVRTSYFKLRGRHGLGLGDVKFLGAAGAWVGWDGLPLLLLIGSVSGLAMVLGMHLKGRRTTLDDRIAFGPHLAFGLLVVWTAKAFELG